MRVGVGIEIVIGETEGASVDAEVRDEPGRRVTVGKRNEAATLEGGAAVDGRS